MTNKKRSTKEKKVMECESDISLYYRKYLNKSGVTWEEYLDIYQGLSSYQYDVTLQDKNNELVGSSYVKVLFNGSTGENVAVIVGLRGWQKKRKKTIERIISEEAKEGKTLFLDEETMSLCAKCEAHIHEESGTKMVIAIESLVQQTRNQCLEAYEKARNAIYRDWTNKPNPVEPFSIKMCRKLHTLHRNYEYKQDNNSSQIILHGGHGDIAISFDVEGRVYIKKKLIDLGWTKLGKIPEQINEANMHAVLACYTWVKENQYYQIYAQRVDQINDETMPIDIIHLVDQFDKEIDLDYKSDAMFEIDRSIRKLEKRASLTK